jgi:hypothetical protein
MRPDPITVTLGDLDFTIRPLTLGQVRKVEEILLDPARAARGNIPVAMDIVAVALRRDYQEEASNIDDLEGTSMEVMLAQGAILRLSGFLEAGEPGEEKAA